MQLTTFNVGLLDVWLFGKKVFEFAAETRARANAQLVHLSGLKCDILFIQELFRSDDQSKLIAALSEKFPYSHSSTQRVGGLLLNHGLLILSRYPLTNFGERRFESQLMDERYLGPKGYISAICDVPGTGQILLTNTHTSAGGFFQHPESKKTDAVRGKQLSELANYANRTKFSVIAGDLNCGPDVSIGNFIDLLSHGFVRPELHVPSFKDGPTWDPKNPLNVDSPHKTSPAQRIDHILLSQSLSNRTIGSAATFEFVSPENISGRNITLSDHYGFTVTLTDA